MESLETGEGEPPALLPVADNRGLLLGTALYSPASQIALRMVSREAIDEAQWLELLESGCGRPLRGAAAAWTRRRILPAVLQRGRRAAGAGCGQVRRAGRFCRCWRRGWIAGIRRGLRAGAARGTGAGGDSGTARPAHARAGRAGGAASGAAVGGRCRRRRRPARVSAERAGFTSTPMPDRRRARFSTSGRTTRRRANGRNGWAQRAARWTFAATRADLRCTWRRSAAVTGIDASRASLEVAEQNL